MTETDRKILDKLHGVLLDIFREFNRVCQKYGIVYYAAYGTLIGVVRHKGFIPWDTDIDIWMTRREYEKLYAHRDEFGGDYELVAPQDYGENKYYTSIPVLSSKRAYVKMDKELCEWYDNKCNRLHLDIYMIDRTPGGLEGVVHRTVSRILLSLMYPYAHPKRPKTDFLGRRVIEAILRMVVRRVSLSSIQRCFDRFARKYEDSPRGKYIFNSVTMDTFVKYPAQVLEDPKWAIFEGEKIMISKMADAILRKYYGDYMQLPPEDERVPHWFGLDKFISAEDFFFLE